MASIGAFHFALLQIPRRELTVSLQTLGRMSEQHVR
jgi:hypothetical protein